MGMDRSSSVVLICDCIRSIPLFYSVNGDKIYVSGNGELIGRETGARLHDENVEEFLRAGYVTENETLYHNVYQVGPGEIVTINKCSGKVSTEHYFELCYRMDAGLGEKELMYRYDEVLLTVFGDLIRRLKGAAALIPLSGGCDSRTAAVMLKRLCYENVICFAYGRKGCMEVEISEKVAENLGFPWLYVEYDGKKWMNFYQSREYHDFLKFSCLGVGIGCVQALPAVLELKEKGLIPSDAVVIPGHTQDVTAGSHIPAVMLEASISRKYFIQTILDGHYDIARNRKHNCRTAIRKWSNGLPARMDSKQSILEYQKWEWKNRQAKFIANDVRTYEYAFLSWELPFWDRRNCEFWMSVPAEMLQGRYLQYVHMKEKIDPVCGLEMNYSFVHGSRSLLIGKERIKALIRKAAPWAAVMKNYPNRLKEHKTNQAAFYDFLSEKEYKQCLRKYGMRFTVNSLTAEAYVASLR